LYVNVFVGWTTYFLAAYFAEKAIWLGMATITVSIGNIISHTLFFNIKGRTWYNASLTTCWLLFAPASFFFGIALNVFGILKLIDWMKNKDTRYIFPQHCLLPKDRKQ